MVVLVVVLLELRVVVWAEQVQLSRVPGVALVVGRELRDRVTELAALGGPDSVGAGRCIREEKRLY